MKKVFAVLFTLIITLGLYTSVFADTTVDLDYNVVLNGEKLVFEKGEVINSDGVSLLTLDCYVAKFGFKRADVVKAAEPVVYGGRQYYPLRPVMEDGGMKVFWDSATSTALIIDEGRYEQIKELFEASNTESNDLNDLKNVEMEIKGKINAIFDLAGLPMNFAAPFNMAFKIDYNAPFMVMSMNMKNDEMGLDANIRMYDDGEKMYANENGGSQWIKTDSALAQSKLMIDQLGKIDPAKNALAEDLSIAGLKLTETFDGYVIEGDMYVAETFNSINFDEIMQQAMGQTGGSLDISLKYDWPNTMYVKYVMDKDGNVKAMDLIFKLGMAIEAEGQAVNIKIDADINVPKIIIGGEFETVVPKYVTDSAVDLSGMLVEVSE